MKDPDSTRYTSSALVNDDHNSTVDQLLDDCLDALNNYGLKEIP